MSIFLQLLGIAGSAFGLYGYYTGNMIFMVIGIVVGFLFCKQNEGSLVEWIVARIFVIPLLALPGMFICHFGFRMGFGISYLLCFNWLLAAASVLFLFSTIKEHLESAKRKK